MTPMMKRLCEAVERVTAPGMDDAPEVVVRAVLGAMKEVDRPILGAVGDFNADYSFDNGRDPPFSQQLGVAINAIMS